MLLVSIKNYNYTSLTLKNSFLIDNVLLRY